MRITVIGDIGVSENMIHIGDEAMFEALIDAMRRRGITDITGISASPVESAERYAISSIDRIGFAGRDRDDQADRMQRVVESASGADGLLASNDPARAVIESIRRSDGVAIAGGGNLASNWPTHIFERATIAAVAAALETPLVVSGQTIGPSLTDPDAVLVAQMLGSARFIGLREHPSYELCRRIGVPAALLHETVDDASFLVSDATGSAEATPSGPAPYCAVTLARHVGDTDSSAFISSCARLLDDIAARTGLQIAFFAHFASTVGGDIAGDSIVHEQVRSTMASESHVIPTTDARAAAIVARNASLVVTSRYHPAVFAAARGVPTIGIPVDEYTTTKLSGALRNFDQSGVVPASTIVAGNALDDVVRVWSDRDAIRARASAADADRRATSEAWWDRVAATFSRAAR